MAKSNKKTVVSKSGQASLVQTLHGSKGFIAGKLGFKAQKAHRVQITIYGLGLPTLRKILADFARTGVVNPQNIYAQQSPEFNGNPMIALRAGPQDKVPFLLGKTKAGMLAEALRGRTQDQVLSALDEVIGASVLRLDRDAETETTTPAVQAPLPFMAPAPAAPTPAPAATVTGNAGNAGLIAKTESEISQLMRRVSMLTRYVAMLRVQDQVA